MSYTEDFLKILYGDSRKTDNHRKIAMMVLEELRASKSARATDLFVKVGHKKTFYKVLKKLKDVRLVRTFRDNEKKVYYQLEPKEFKGVFTNLIDKVVEELK